MNRTKTMTLWKTANKFIDKYLALENPRDTYLRDELQRLKINIASRDVHDDFIDNMLIPILDVLESKTYYQNMHSVPPTSAEELDIIQNISELIRKTEQMRSIEEDAEKKRRLGESIEKAEETRLPNMTSESEIKEKYYSSKNKL